ncbi:MAG: non-canonical purine NTP pyrophosphatase [Clostridia bacterium]|nr:non-canonical purine NTP pyrophosphatase [Clostridia bacterium]
MNKLVVASENEGKIFQIKNFLSEYDVNINIKGMKDFDINSPIENGKTYAENALIKARHTFKITGLPTLADDSGLNIDFLNGFPGLVTARFAEACGGYEKSFEIISKCLEGSSKRISFSTAVAFVYEKGGEVIEKVFEGKINGEFVYPPRGENGFGYCPCFKMDGYDKTLAELSDEEIVEINHRSIALKKFMDFFKNEFKE